MTGMGYNTSSSEEDSDNLPTSSLLPSDSSPQSSARADTPHHSYLNHAMSKLSPRRTSRRQTSAGITSREQENEEGGFGSSDNNIGGILRRLRRATSMPSGWEGHGHRDSSDRNNGVFSLSDLMAKNDVPNKPLLVNKYGEESESIGDGIFSLFDNVDSKTTEENDTSAPVDPPSTHKAKARQKLRDSQNRNRPRSSKEHRRRRRQQECEEATSRKGEATDNHGVRTCRMVDEARTAGTITTGPANAADLQSPLSPLSISGKTQRSYQKVQRSNSASGTKRNPYGANYQPTSPQIGSDNNLPKRRSSSRKASGPRRLSRSSTLSSRRSLGSSSTTSSFFQLQHTSNMDVSQSSSSWSDLSPVEAQQLALAQEAVNAASAAAKATAAAVEPLKQHWDPSLPAAMAAAASAAAAASSAAAAVLASLQSNMNETATLNLSLVPVVGTKRLA